MGEDLSCHNSVNAVELSHDENERMNAKVTNIARISRSYNKRRENGGVLHCILPTTSNSGGGKTKSSSSPKSVPVKTKKKGYFRFESKSRGSKKLARLIGK